MSDEKNSPGASRREWVEKMREIFVVAGEALPDEIACLRPFVYVDLAPDDFARKCGELLVGTNLLFKRGQEIGTVEQDGSWLDMTPDRLRTFLPDAAGIFPFKHTDSSDGKPIKVGIPVELARAVLASDTFRVKLPELRAVNQVKMPVVRDTLDERDNERRKGFKKLELLPLGYDAATMTYTVLQGPDFDEEMDPEEAIAWLRSLFKYFAFSDRERLAVQIAGMLSVFGKGIYKGRPPMFLSNSNLAGSGKSRLSQLMIEPVYGEAAASGYSYEKREEVRKELDSAAQVYSPYLWFDDVPKGVIRSTDLNRWLTSKTWQCRIMGGNKIFKGPLLGVTIMTGAQIELDPMLARRTLIVDLFPRQKSRNRALPEDAILINDAFFECEDMRRKILSCLWAVIRFWDDMGRPGLSEIPVLEGERPLESFEGWSTIIPPIVAATGWGNCLKSFTAPDAGDTETREFEKLAQILIRAHAVGRDSAVIKQADTVCAARKNGLFVELLGSLDDVFANLDRQKNWVWKLPDEVTDMDDGPRKEKLVEDEKRHIAASYTDNSIQSGWGKKIRKSAIFGQLFEVDGEVWEFGTRESRIASFIIKRVTEAPKMGVI
jgi:hypothetical protein